jgi:suppressor of ftsI
MQRQPEHRPGSQQRGRGTLPRRLVGRRELLRLAAGAVTVGAVGGGLILPRGFTRRAAAAESLVEPEVRASRDGLLDTTLEASVRSLQVAGQAATMALYEGSLPGPTLRVRPGDRLRVNLVNSLPPDAAFLCPLPSSDQASDAMHEMSCATNLHVHGLHVSPLGNSDNIFLNIDPGERFQYEYQIPADHPPGLYWYHPHVHGSVHTQLFAGMAGAIIIEGELDRLPGIAGLRERLLMLQTTQFAADGTVLPQEDPDARQSDYLRLVNGQLNPTMTIAPGETQRWRIGNASPSTTFRLQLDGHPLQQIAKDGNPFSAVWSRDTIELHPAERVEVLVQGGAPGSYALRTLPIATGFTTQVASVLATLTSSGDPVTPQPLPATLLGFDDLSTLPVDRRRQITFQVRSPIGPGVSTFPISGQLFDADRIDAQVRLNTTEEWVIRNASTVWHPFHIHINPYQVMAVNGAALPLRSYEDTTGVPPLGEIRIRTRFLDYPGKWVYHCHVALHEDGGMMGTVLADG